MLEAHNLYTYLSLHPDLALPTRTTWFPPRVRRLRNKVERRNINGAGLPSATPSQPVPMLPDIVP